MISFQFKKSKPRAKVLNDCLRTFVRLDSISMLNYVNGSCVIDKIGLIRL